MRCRIPSILLAALLLHIALPPCWAAPAAASPAVSVAEPWQSPYSGPQATGQNVIGLWKFDAGAETADASGHKLSARLDGAQLSPAGRFGGCLESFPGFPASDKHHAAVVPNDPRLSPRGAFTLELWIKPKPESAQSGDNFLLDKKYVAHDDYQLILGGGSERSSTRILRACLGFGADSATWYSRPLVIQPDLWYHVAFTYDGQGTGSFFLNDTPQGSTTIPGCKAVSPGRHPLSIGDRLGSNYRGFPGFIDEVRISAGALEFRRVKLACTSDRTCFRRMEPKASIRLEVTNLQPTPLEAATVRVSLGGLAPHDTPLDELKPGATAAIDYPVDTSLRPDTYHLTARVELEKPQPGRSAESFDVQIVPRQPPRMPVLMWGIHGGVSQEVQRLKQVGFTHALGLAADYQRIWEAGEPEAPEKPERMADNFRMLDEALANDITVVASLSPGSWLRGRPALARVNRQGQPAVGKSGDICALQPEIVKFCGNVGRSVGAAYGRFPAFSGALIHTEVRDAAQPCFHALDLAAYRKASGREVPPQAAGRGGVDYHKLPGFPASHVIADDDPLYAYYQWYWKHGDGWNDLNTAVDQGLKAAAGRPDLWTFHDPAARVASVYGSGGSVNFLSQWTYSYPDPIRIGLATDELLAFAAGGPPGQQVMKMTQIIWYRSQTAPAAKPGAPPPAYQAPWEIDQPDAPFITIAPMQLREALWTKIARPIKGIMYHGWQSLFPCSPETGYRHTNPQTRDELARLIRQVIRPLGPTLLAVPAAKSDVAFLESFAAEMFAGRGTYGWGGKWLGDAHEVCLWAHLQPEIVFDETIVQRGLDGYKVLVMCDCDVITQKMLQRIEAFQRRGGVIVGDDHTAPAVKPDIVLTPYLRQGRADADKAALQAVAVELRKKLDARYRRYLDATSLDLVPYRRTAGTADYLFVVNDRREYGQYVGQHGLVMENGLPVAGELYVARPDAAVYDLVEGRPVTVAKGPDGIQFPVRLGPGEGRVFLAMPQPIGGVMLAGPGRVERGRPATLQATVVDPQSNPVRAVIPMEVTIRDAEGRVAEGSGYYAARNGQLALTLDIAPNDIPGAWQVDVRELASRESSTMFFQVAGPTPWPPAAQPLPKELANPVQPKG